MAEAHGALRVAAAAATGARRAPLHSCSLFPVPCSLFPVPCHLSSATYPSPCALRPAPFALRSVDADVTVGLRSRERHSGVDMASHLARGRRRDVKPDGRSKTMAGQVVQSAAGAVQGDVEANGVQVFRGI